MSANVNNVSYICVKDAVNRGFGSRVTVMRWVKDGSVRSFRQGSFRMVCVEDLETCVAARERVVTEEELVERLAKQIANAAPVLSAEGKEHLARLLR